MAVALDPLPPLGAHQLLRLLLLLGTLLLLAVCLGRLARRVGLPAVAGELLTGVLLGPSLLGWAAPGIAAWLLPHDADQAHLLDAVGQLGMLLLVGLTGAQLDTRIVYRRGAVVWVGGGALVAPLALGVATGFVVPAALLSDSADRATFAVFLGVAMCVSALPVIAKTLADMNMQHRDVSHLAVAAAAVDDVVGWFLLSVVSAMAVSGLTPGGIVASALALVGFMVLAVALGRPAVGAALRAAASADDPGAYLATTVVIILLGAAGSHALGSEAVLGAFVAGVLVGRPEVVDPARLAPLRAVVMSVLAPIFLASAGLRIDLTALASPDIVLTCLGIVFVAVLGKLVGAYLGARLSRLGNWEALALGAALNARGVVEVVVATVGLRLGVLSAAMYTIIVLLAVVTSFMAPPMLRWSMERVRWNAEERLREARFATVSEAGVGTQRTEGT